MSSLILPDSVRYAQQEKQRKKDSKDAEHFYARQVPKDGSGQEIITTEQAMELMRDPKFSAAVKLMQGAEGHEKQINFLNRKMMKKDPAVDMHMHEADVAQKVLKANREYVDNEKSN